MTVREALLEAGGELRAAGCPTPHVDAELLLAHALGVSRTELFSAPERPLADAEARRFRGLVGRRAAREPAAYILGEWGFRRLTLAVDPRVLVPRPETETVVEHALSRISGISEPLVLDVGTGSGAIALAIADEHPGARVVATDISADALAVAAWNRAGTGLEERVELVLGHLAAGLRGPFDLVVSNPPYVTPEEVDVLDPEVRLYEPREAVVGVGQTEGVARRAREILRPGGWVVLECADGKAEDVAAELRALGYEDVVWHRDYAGRQRVVEGRRPQVVQRSPMIDRAVAAIRAGEVVVLPTDTVYGLVADGYREAPARRLYALKRRPETMPCALLAADLEVILDAVPELRGRAAVAARALLPGPYTLVLPNPARRFRWLAGDDPGTIGIRVPDLPAEARAVLDRVGAVASTSANLHGEADPRRVDDVPEKLRRAAGAVVDVGELPGKASTVLDLTGPEPRVLREGAVPAAEALERARAALAAQGA